MSTTSLPQQIANLRLITGKGNYSAGTACVMSAAVALDRLRKGEPLGEATDELECVCPVIRRLAIGRNDGWWPSDEARTDWGLKLVPKLLDTRADRARTVRRAFRVADVAVRFLAPIALRAQGRRDLAEKLERLEPVVNKASAMAARSAVYTAADAAAADYTVYDADAATFVARTSATTSAIAYAAAAAADHSIDDVSVTYAADAAANTAPYAAYCATYYAKAATWSHIDRLIEEFIDEPRD